MREQVICRDDIVERKVMRDHYAQIDPARGDHIHESPHALLAARTQGRDNLVIAQTRSKS